MIYAEIWTIIQEHALAESVGETLGGALEKNVFIERLASVLKSKNLNKEFPLFSKIHEIAFEGKPASAIVEL